MNSKEQQLIKQFQDIQKVICQALSQAANKMDFSKEYTQIKNLFTEFHDFEFGVDFYKHAADLVKSITQLRNSEILKKKDLAHLNNLVEFLRKITHKHPLLKQCSFVNDKRRNVHDIDRYVLYVKEVVEAADKTCIKTNEVLQDLQQQHKLQNVTSTLVQQVQETMLKMHLMNLVSSIAIDGMVGMELQLRK